jgi:hypothetical protein
MELDELQSIWKQGHKNLLKNNCSVEEIQNLLQKKTKGILYHINKSIFIEVILLLVISVYSMYFFYPIDKRISGLVLGFLIISSGHYYIKYRLLNYSSSQSLKISLQRLMRILSRYLYVYQGAVWVALAIMGWAGGAILSERNWTWWLTGLVVGSFGVIFYLIFQWYLELLYGKQLKELEKCWQDLIREEG